jgi:hypothetical protein
MCGETRYRSRRYDIGRREDPDMRASDADRERVAQLLRDSAGDGRLDMDELSERLDSAYAARTFGELRAVTRDLPVAPPRPSTELARPRHRPSAFVWISVMLIAIWALTGAGYFWPLWPMLWFAFAAMRYRGRYRRRTAGTYV